MVERPEAWKWSSHRATAGRESPPPCLTTDWILGQFSRTRTKAEQEYRQFVDGGIGKDPIWSEIKGQTILGDDDFVESQTPHIKDRRDIPAIPKSHRFVSRPGLDEIFSEKMMQDKIKRDKRIIEAVQKYGYTQQQIAAHLNVHYSTVSNLVRGKT
jgi:Helix-turn-helix.